jgi:hypothetical protein
MERRCYERVSVLPPVLEMYRRSVADHSAPLLLARLGKRLAKILTETSELNPPQT